MMADANPLEHEISRTRPFYRYNWFRSLKPMGWLDFGSCSKDSMDKALAGIRVLDLSHVQAGPSCTQILGWLGADVIKVELPGRGDVTRSQLRDLPEVDSLYFTMLNCNKRSITLNLKSGRGKEILTELIRRSDDMVENF